MSKSSQISNTGGQTHRDTVAESSSHDDHSRGQVILIGVVTIGILLISMTLVLNTFLFSQNIESKGAPAEVTAIEDTQRVVHTEFGELLIRTNDNQMDPESEFQSGSKTARSAIRAQQTAGRGTVVDVSLESNTSGTLIQQNESGDFTDANGDQWHTDVNSVRRFQIHVENLPSTGIGSDLNQGDDISTPAGVFQVKVNNTESWTLYLFPDASGDIVIATSTSADPTPSVQYTTSADSLTVDLTTGSVAEDGSPTADAVNLFEFAEGVDQSTRYTIEYQNPEAITGKYTLTVDGGASIDGEFNNAWNSPYTKDAIYQATYSATYETADDRYESTQIVRPCAPEAMQCLTYMEADA